MKKPKFIIKELKYPRHIFCKPLLVDGRTPDYAFYKYKIYKLQIFARWTDPENGEWVYLVVDESGAEICLLYFTLSSPVEIEMIRYWRDITMDAEITNYLLKWLLIKLQ
jgi:hypothetical protein